ncbi:hypothetical protein ACHWQZ_G019670 [Mnemiopsis leidyi]
MQESHQQDLKTKHHQLKETRNEGQVKSTRMHRQSSYRLDKDYFSNDRSREKRHIENFNGDRSNSQKYRDPRCHNGNRKNNGYLSKAKHVVKKDDFMNKDLLPSEKIATEEKADVTKKHDSSESLALISESNKSLIKVSSPKVKSFHGHYHHKNSNKPRFSKIFSENGKNTKASVEKPAKNEDNNGEECSSSTSAYKNVDLTKGSAKNDAQQIRNEPLIDQLKVISQELNKSPKTEDVFAKLKSSEVVENLKELYDQIPDITKTEIIKETEEWSTSVPDKVLQEACKTNNELSDELRSFPCCPHGNCYPPLLQHGFLPPALHPAYYYTALWNFHHPLPPPPVQRLANAPSLPPSTDTGGVHKRYITRSSKTPGTIDFTLHAADNLRIVSVRCEDVFSMTADLCNEEGEKIAENFVLHSDTSPKLWEQYAFSGNHTLHFNVTAPNKTVVVVTFLHEIPLRRFDIG